MDLGRIESGCKINLFLRVTGRRGDGYHTLETVFLPLAVPSDTLEADLDAAPGVALEVDDRELPGGMDNLVCRAAARYAEAAGIEPRWRFVLKKSIPIAAGLGGGSADAAAVLKLLNGRFGALDIEKLKAVALALGADVPFFLDPHPASAGGVGEELELVRSASAPPLLLVNPGFPVSAKWAYREFDRRGVKASERTLRGVVSALERGDIELLARNVRNDLGAALWRKFPVLTLIRNELAARGALAVEVSGSGPTLFAVMPDTASARRAEKEIASEHPRWRCFAAEGSR